MNQHLPIHTNCLNCGDELHGRYCSRCGQADGELQPPMSHVLGEVFHDLIHLDHRVLGTLRLLVLRPGQLTQEYMAGRRSRFLPPFRLYIFISFVLFLLLGYSGSKIKVKARAQEGNGIHVIVGEDAKPALEAVPELAEGGPEAKPGEWQGLKHGINAAIARPDAFVTHLLHSVSKVMFVLLPAFAGLLYLLFIRTRRVFVEHVIFSLHFHAFVFIVFIAQWGLGRIPWGWVSLLSSLLTLAIPIHLGLALRRVYAPKTGKLLLKGALLSAAYFVVAFTGMLAAAFWAVTHGEV